MTVRWLAVGALGLAAVLVAVLVLTSGAPYELTANFQNASGLVTGDNVLIGPGSVGTVRSISLTPDGEAAVGLSLDSSVGTLHQGTVARIFEDSLSGIASRYVELEPGPSAAPPIPNGGTIGITHTYSEVNIDQLFNTFDPLTRAGLGNLIRGEAASLAGKGQAASRALEYLAPGLQSTAQVTAELTRDEPVFDSLLVQGAKAMQALAARSTQLRQLIANTSAATGAIASQSQALQQALTLLPGTLTRSSTAFSGLRTTLDRLDPLVAASKPAVRRLPQFLTALRALVSASIPTVGALDALIHSPSQTGDLTQLALATPQLAKIAAGAFSHMVDQFNASTDQVAYLRQYWPDVVAALADLGQAGAYYDANGHYVRTQPDLFPFALNSSDQLSTQPPSQRYQKLTSVRKRCPGSAVQPSPDGSTPASAPGCDTTAVPPGP